MAFLVPYFYGRHFIDSLALGVGVASTHSSKVARVDLMTSTYRSVRIHGVETDFGEYYDFDMRDGLRYQRGTAAYAGQVHTHDVAEYAGEPDARGFFDGFVHERTLRSQTDLETVAYRYALRETVSAEALASMALAKEDVGICTVESFQDPVDRKVNRTEYVTTSYGFLVKGRVFAVGPQ
ncbi:hypothetical protein M885DRAFT_16129 [Pelagophyceae sp. CCMP2097]|nr:hypothetical protein M885DRAFT_16129 [Pelagophyceae sp. CCMP2097]